MGNRDMKTSLTQEFLGANIAEAEGNQDILEKLGVTPSLPAPKFK